MTCAYRAVVVSARATRNGILLLAPIIVLLFWQKKSCLFGRGNSMLQWIWFRYYLKNEVSVFRVRELVKLINWHIVCILGKRWLVQVDGQQWEIAQIRQVFFIIWAIALCSDRTWCNRISSKAQKVLLLFDGYQLLNTKSINIKISHNAHTNNEPQVNSKHW